MKSTSVSRVQLVASALDTPVALIALALALALAACGPKGMGNDNQNQQLDAGPEVVGLALLPTEATIEVVDGSPVSQDFVATLQFADGGSQDVSSEALFSTDTLLIASMMGARLTARGQAAGVVTVTAAYAGQQANAVVTVNVQSSRILAGAPADAPALFAAAGEDPSLAPDLAYPSPGAVFPPNLGDFEVHWRDAAGADLFEVTVGTPQLSMRAYVAAVPLAGSWVSYLVEEWDVIAASVGGGDFEITVRGLVTAAPDVAGTTSATTFSLERAEVQGGIYYWAASSQSGAAGVYRHDMSRPGESAEAFYTTDNSPGNRCVACHVISREGDQLAVTYDGGDGSAGSIDVATGAEIIAIDNFFWNFATYEPGGERILTAHHGVLELRDATSGAVVATASTSYGTHPDFAPAGDAITYAEVTVTGSDWAFSTANIVARSFDPLTNVFGPPTTLVTNSGNTFYPCFSPDGEWILYNRSDENAYDDASADLWIVRADGTEPPFLLASPNVSSGLTNSWGRWAPFEQLDAAGDPMFWFTFSSKREFGVRRPGIGNPQIWMAPFYPARAEAGLDPSAPAFRLPFQDLLSNNHIAQWTTQVIPVQ